MKPLLTIVCLSLLSVTIYRTAFVEHENDLNPTKNTLVDQRLEDKLYPEIELQIAKQYPFDYAGVEAKENAIREALLAVKGGQRSEGVWETQGPGNIGARINTIAVNLDDNDIIFVGFSLGGIWRTTNGGQDWEPVFDDQTNSSIGKIIIHPTNSDVIFAGTGDLNIGGYFKVGDGLYRSDDNGDTWTYLGMKELRIISSLYIDPTNPNIMYMGAMGPPYIRSNDRGLYKSVDGGNTWQQSLFIDDQTGVIELAVHPENSDILYAAAWTRIRNNKESIINSDKAGVYRSQDGGDTWEKLQGGLPTEETSRVGITMTPQDPNVLYSIVVSADNQNPDGVYRTEDGGDTWDKWNPNNPTFNFALGGFGWYFGRVSVDPNNINKIYVQGVDLISLEMKDTIAVEREAPQWGTYEVHADKHDLVFANNIGFLATDGGLYKADFRLDSLRWEDLENIPTTQYYRVGYNPHNPNTYYGGAQDNGTSAGNIDGINEWERIFGGDGFQVAFQQNNLNTWFVETQRGRISATQDNGDSWEGATDGVEGSRHWDMQYIISPHNDTVMYTATQQVYKTSNGFPLYWLPVSDTIVDESKEAVIHQATSIDQSPIDINTLYVGTSDGLVWRSIDEANSWDLATNGLPDRYVSSIKASPNEASNAIVTFSGYRDGHFTPLVYKTTDYGTSWVPVAGDLPNVAINDVLIYPQTEGDSILFVATDLGVYFTINGGVNWDRLGDNMPVVSVFDMDLNIEKNELIVATFGRSIMTFVLDQVNIPNNVSSTTSFSDVNIQLYPNPAFDFITVKGKVSNKRYSIIDIHAKVVENGVFKKNENQISLRNYRGGIYILKLQDHSTRFVIN